MRVIVAGYGIQGQKRKKIAGDECVAIIDPFSEYSNYHSILDIPLNDFDAAMVCTPDNAKVEIIDYLISHGKHILVEKPLLTSSSEKLLDIKNLALENSVSVYTAYNHRFEPSLIKLKSLLESQELGEIYTVRMFYGNGTARLVRQSPWRDTGMGVITDLGSHLLDISLFLFGSENVTFTVRDANCFENAAPDHCVMVSNKTFNLQAEMTLLSWRNHFSIDILAEHGSAHLDSLCKWGPASFIHRKRLLPSGRPDEENLILIQSDPTWRSEYNYFKELCQEGGSNIDNDIWIQSQFDILSNRLN